MLIVNMTQGVACRGAATTSQTRQARHMSGLLLPSQGGLDIEVERAKAALQMRSSELDKYQVGSMLHFRNRPLSSSG